MKYLQTFAVVALAYVLCHGLTAFLVTPLQSQVFPDLTRYASLLYLPHGVRVLSAWLLGWRAFLPLCAGGFLSEVLFTPAEFSSVTDPVILVSIAIGGSAAILSFELLRLLGLNLYAGRDARVHWRWLLVAGIMASLLNSGGQAVVFSGMLPPDRALGVLAVYAAGDLFGLVATTLALMMVFRWMRLAPGYSRAR
ncbi:hypothetical protein [Poseidonocella sp. HB161398]|uniref:hypothetical protein n=1 Tax=Poseidonocella sp. HB161398 TaxID=2320855 RepID=UPI001108030D|nr:hypothetical protein [Poseidonocella sp. HB161398]